MPDKNIIIPVDQVLPNKIPIIVLQGKPIFPGVFSPVLLTQKQDIDATDFSQEHASNHIGFLLTKEQGNPSPDITNLYETGTVAKIVKKVNLPDDGYNIFISTVKRFSVRRFIPPLNQNSVLSAIVDYVDEKSENTEETRALTRALIAEMKVISEDNPLFSEEVRLNMVNIDQPGRIADFIASILNIDRKAQQEVLETLDIHKRIEKVLLHIKKEQELLRIQKRIQGQINEKIEKNKREFFLREQLKEIQNELGIRKDGKHSEIDTFRKKIDALKLSDEIKKQVDSELEKFSMLETNNPEYSMQRNYLDLITRLPWNSEPPKMPTLKRAISILNRDHYGLEDVKERITEFLAVKIKKNDSRGSIICLLGPPGVGKTSIGKSIAAALGRSFFRFSVGGMRDEAEIKGHRRTYIGAMPGKILQGLKQSKSKHAVFMIDEVDKLGASYQGDPSSALLEVLDPEQNLDFRDHYLDLPFDLSQVIFVVTANTSDSIPGPLLDRMEIIRLSGYVEPEKVQIARKYLVPKSIKEHGLQQKDVIYTQKALKILASQYAREAGVRTLEKLLNRIHRKLVFSIVSESLSTPVTIDVEDVKKYLGKPYFSLETTTKITRPGIAIGLAWTAYGGEVLIIEALRFESSGGIKLTGQLGDVMKESAAIALSYVRSIATDYNIDTSIFDQSTIHLHIPAGATPKDGPSAGITMTTALLSLLTHKKIKRSYAMTGELSLTGEVLPIGGLREKIIAAKRYGIKHIIAPRKNELDVEEIQERVRKGVSIHFVDTMDDVIRLVF